MTDAVQEYREAGRFTLTSLPNASSDQWFVPASLADAAIAELEAKVEELDDKLMEAEGAHDAARRWFEEQKKQFARAEKAEAEVQRLRVAEAEAMNILEGTELKLEQAEAEVALRDRMLRDIIERIALTPERWNGWTTEEVLADLRARAEKEESDG